MRKSRFAATLALLAVPLGSISGSVDPSGATPLAGWESGVAHALEDAGHRATHPSGADAWAHDAALLAAPYSFELTGRSSGGPVVHFGAHPRQGPSPPAAPPALSAPGIRLALLSHLDHVAGSAATRSGALSARSTSIPPPLHA